MFIIVVLTLLGYGLVHSWLASTHLKQSLRQLVGNQLYYGLYRVSYNVVAIVTLTPILGLVVFRPGHSIWEVTGLARYGLLLIQAVGLIGVIVSLLQIQLGQFVGWTQVSAYFKGQPLPLPIEPLQFGGLYRLVRHPLYFFSLMVIWPMSTMSESLLAFNIGATIYFIAGSILEERKLVAVYGEAYRDYQRRTPALIPFTNRLRER
ncbi:MAG: DUF1295 domain-containing protein [Anaerolineaceae bacterium]|nr:DUF1295 domain-containing protein [Anaerolineaceae bacterium]